MSKMRTNSSNDQSYFMWHTNFLALPKSQSFNWWVWRLTCKMSQQNNNSITTSKLTSISVSEFHILTTRNKSFLPSSISSAKHHAVPITCQSITCLQLLAWPLFDTSTISASHLHRVEQHYSVTAYINRLATFLPPLELLTYIN